jgi:transketolase
MHNSLSKEIRKLIIDAAFNAKHGHIPSALSIVEIIVAVHIIKYNQDEFILSKGHGCLALYSYLVTQNKLTKQELRNFGKKGSSLGGHPDRNKVKEIYASTGSLGHGLPIAVGAALARKIQKIPGLIYCVVGDGESNEGTIWESFILAAKHNLNNLVCIVDNNKSQTRSLPTTNLVDKIKAFGWEVIETDGHCVDDLIKVLKYNKSNKPFAIVANTVKGKGISDIENDMFAWHHRAPSKEEYTNFINEINEA